MERDYFSQPVDKLVRDSKSLYYSQPPGYSHELNQGRDTCSTLQNPENRSNEISVDKNSSAPSENSTLLESETTDDNVDKLFDCYKSISDELTSSLREYNSQTISLENQIVRLDQENDYLKLETDRQLAQIDEINETPKTLHEKLTKEEVETKRIVELKLIEIQEMCASIETTDKFITDFKRSFSESMVGAELYCNNLKKEFKEFKDNFFDTSTDYKNNFDSYSSSCTEELSFLKRNISDVGAIIENGTATIKEKSLEEARIKQDLNNVLQEIELEQKRRKDLANSLLQHKDTVAKLKRDHESHRSNKASEFKGKNELHSQLKNQKTGFDGDISSSENDLLTLKDRCNENVAEMDSLQVVLVKKRHDDESIQKEIESLEKQAEGLRNENDSTHSENELKKHIEVELKELEDEISVLMIKCDDLEETRNRTSEDDRSEHIPLEKKNLEIVQTKHNQIQQHVNQTAEKLEQKVFEKTSVQQESQLLRNILNEKLALLVEAANGEKELEDLRSLNILFINNAERCQRKIEEKNEIVSFLEQLKIKQNEVFENWENELDDISYSRDENNIEEVFETYSKTLDVLKELKITDIEKGIIELTADIESCAISKEDACEAHEYNIKQIQALHESSIKDLITEFKENDNHCKDLLAKLKSDKSTTEVEILNIEDNVTSKRNELNVSIPILISSVSNALSLYEKIINYYSQACDNSLSGSSSMHWENAKEVILETLTHPLHKVSKLKGMPPIGPLAATPHGFYSIINRGKELFGNIVKTKNRKHVEHATKRLVELRKALYSNQNDECPESSRLNDTFHSTSTED